MEIKGILVTELAPFENHIANGGEKLLGNASSIKRRPDGRVYISGQMQRHVLFSAINRLNMSDADHGNTFVSNGDGITNQIENDLSADMGGFMHPSRGDYSGRRTGPLICNSSSGDERKRSWTRPISTHYAWMLLTRLKIKRLQQKSSVNTI
jgi:CRISPR-associated protein Cst2